MIFIPAIRRNILMAEEARTNPEIQGMDKERRFYEQRLWILLWLAPCLPIGLIGFAWTSTGPPLPWIASAIFAGVIGIANFAIYGSTIDYLLVAYGQYSASATGGNGFSRDFLAGVLTLPAVPFYENLGNVAYPTTILFCLSTILVACVYIVYWKGPQLRAKSPFAQHLKADRIGEKSTGGKQPSRRNSEARSEQDRRVRPSQTSRQASYAASIANSRQSSRRNSTQVDN